VSEEAGGESPEKSPVVTIPGTAQGDGATSVVTPVTAGSSEDEESFAARATTASPADVASREAEEGARDDSAAAGEAGKERGNEAFKNGRYEEALGYYGSALEKVSSSHVELRASLLCNGAAAALSLARRAAKSRGSEEEEVLRSALERAHQDAVEALRVLAGGEPKSLALKAAVRKCEALVAYGRFEAGLGDVFVFDRPKEASRLADEVVLGEDLASVRRELCGLVFEAQGATRARVGGILASLAPDDADWFARAAATLRTEANIDIDPALIKAWKLIVRKFADTAALVAADFVASEARPTPSAEVHKTALCLANRSGSVPAGLADLLARAGCAPKAAGALDALRRRGADLAKTRAALVTTRAWLAGVEAFFDLVTAPKNYDLAQVREYFAASVLASEPRPKELSARWAELFSGLMVGLFFSLSGRGDALEEIYGAGARCAAFSCLLPDNLNRATSVGRDDKHRAALWLLRRHPTPPANMLRLLRRRYGHVHAIRVTDDAKLAGLVRLSVHKTLDDAKLEYLKDATWREWQKAGFLAQLQLSADFDRLEDGDVASLTWDNFVKDTARTLNAVVGVDDEHEDGEDNEDDDDDEEDDTRDEEDEPSAPSPAPAAPADPAADGSDCIMCLDAKRDTLLLPCRHLALCAECEKKAAQSSNSRECPICRSTVTSTMRIYC